MVGPPCSLHPARLPSWGLGGHKALSPRQRQGSARGEHGGWAGSPAIASSQITSLRPTQDPGANPVLHGEGGSGCLFEELL